MYPKGKLLIIGGAEDLAGKEGPDMENKNIKFKRYEILKQLLSDSKNSVAIVTSASRVQHEMRDAYTYAFDRLQKRKTKFIQIRDRWEAHDKYYLRDIAEAGAVFFTGGDQARLISILKNTPFIHIIKERYQTEREFLIAGTSAGAMALSDIMIASGPTYEAIIARKLKLSAGFGIIDNCIIDTHFIKRGRIGRLAQAVLLHPNHLGIGLGEDTALIIKNGEAECRGSGMVIILDGSRVKSTNITSAKEGIPIYADNLVMHILVKGTHFNFKTHKIL